MDTESFPSFQPLLHVLADYAEKSGFRFRAQDFSSTEFVLVESQGVALQGVALQGVVSSFSHRLKTREPALTAELARAAKIVEQEGLRNVMIATCKELRLWPPSSADRLQSISYSDTSEPLDAIAWALFNHEKCLESNRHQRTCRTASFLVDFGHACGQLDDVSTSKSGSQLLTEFLARATEWTAGNMDQRGGLRRIVLEKLREFADSKFTADIERWIDQHWEAVAVGGVALVVGFCIAALALSHSSKK